MPDLGQRQNKRGRGICETSVISSSESGATEDKSRWVLVGVTDDIFRWALRNSLSRWFRQTHPVLDVLIHILMLSSYKDLNYRKLNSGNR